MRCYVVVNKLKTLNKGVKRLSVNVDKICANPDCEIIQMNNEEALEEIMQKYGEEVKRLVYTYTKSWAQDDDVTQDVFVSIFLKFHTFKQQSLLKTWIYKIAINKCKDYKKSWYQRNIQLTNTLFSFKNGTSDTPESEVFKKDEQSLLMECVLSLPTKYREVILLFYYKEFSIEEIAAILTTNQSTIKTRLKRAREKLHVIYEKRGEQIGS